MNATTCWGPKVSLVRSKAVIELGKKLVAQLDADDDLLASWMAHDIAARMEAVETAPPEQKPAAQDACAKAILDLWRLRNKLPEHLRPLGELEPVLRTLAYLALDPSDPRYYPEAMRAAATASAEGETKRWLEMAIGIDFSARVLVRFALQLAAGGAASDAEPWVELARKAGAEDDREGSVVRIIFANDDAESEPEGAGRAALKDRADRLESFAAMAAGVAEEIRTQLGADESGET